jgi:hypothetical protein
VIGVYSRMDGCSCQDVRPERGRCRIATSIGKEQP